MRTKIAKQIIPKLNNIGLVRLSPKEKMAWNSKIRRSRLFSDPSLCLRFIRKYGYRPLREIW